MPAQPLVSILTPVYNNGDYIGECIESILSQTYENFQYLVVNNCSTDQTLEVVEKYAARDSRVKIHNNNDFLAVIANHNHAFGMMPVGAKDCKIVSGDDAVLPDCIRKLVDAAEANPTAGLIGCYQQSGKKVLWQGHKYPTPCFQGRCVGRDVLLSNEPSFGCGSPTSLLYRADLVRSTKEFYPNPSPHSDTSACFQSLLTSDYAFVYEVLSIERVHEHTQSTTSQRMNRYLSACLNDVLVYGPRYLSHAEFEKLLNELIKKYHRFLAVNYVARSQSEDFWTYHKARLGELGYPLKSGQIIKALISLTAEEIVNPQKALSKVAKYMGSSV